jgi:hypothetical protein
LQLKRSPSVCNACFAYRSINGAHINLATEGVLHHDSNWFAVNLWHSRQRSAEVLREASRDVQT